MSYQYDSAPKLHELWMSPKRDSTRNLRTRIQSYLGNGGLFNPEFMEHDKVRDLLLDLREFIGSK